MGQPLRSQRLRRNLPLLCAFRGLQMTLFPVAVITLYLTDRLGLTLTEIFVLQALFSLFTAVLEFPGGYVADRIGYRHSMLLACGFSVVGWGTYTVADGFALVALSEFLLATGFALTSGTDTALMYESLLELGDEPTFARWLGRAKSTGALSEGTAALVAGLMFAVDPHLPLYAQVVVWLVAAGVAIALIEPARDRTAAVDPVQHARALLAYAATHSPRLRATIATTVVLGLSTFTPVWIIALYAERAGLAVTWIGPMWAVANYALAAGNLVSDRVTDRRGLHTTLGVSVVCVAVGYAGLSLSHAMLGFAFYYAICAGRGLAGPALNHAQQRLIPSSDRAALLSVNSLLFRASFAALGPLFGLAFDTWGDHAVLAGLGLGFTACSSTALLWLRAQPHPGTPSRIEVASADPAR